MTPEAAAIPDDQLDEAARPTEAGRRRAAVELMAARGAVLRATARRFSICADDADDALQRAMEILLKHAPTADLRALERWMHTVTKREAMAVRRARERQLHGAGGSAADPEAIDRAPSRSSGPAEVVLTRERFAQGAEALQALKPDERRALLLRAEGYSYAEICDLTGWTYTKVNRCLAEGRNRFTLVCSDIEDGGRCEQLAAALSAYCDGELDPARRAMVRRHLAGCGACRATAREYRLLPARAAALIPAVTVTSHSRAPWHRAHDWLIAVHARIAGTGDGVATASATSGRGTGLTLAAKLLAVCAGTAGAGAACVAGGAVPAPVASHLHIGSGDAVTSQPAPAPAEQAPSSPEPADSAPHSGGGSGDTAADEPPQPPPPPPVQQEFAPQGAAAPDSGSSTTSRQTSSGGGGKSPPLTDGSGEFGP